MNVGVATLRLYRTHAVLLGRVWQRIQKDDSLDLAAQTSFYFVLSLFPFCLVLAGVVGWLPSTTLWKAFATWMVTYLPTESRELVFSTILGLVNYSTGFLSFGLITALWSASAGFVSLMESLSVAYGVTDQRSFWRKHVLAIWVTFLAAAFALANFGLVAMGHWGFETLSVRIRLWPESHLVWESARWGVTLALMCLWVDLLNFVLPDVRRRWRWLSPGTAFVVVTLVLSSAAFNLYFQHFSEYPKIYGALGGFIVLMLWIYVADLILLVGAETDHEFEKLAREAGTG
jgi:membrane protein